MIINSVFCNYFLDQGEFDHWILIWPFMQNLKHLFQKMTKRWKYIYILYFR